MGHTKRTGVKRTGTKRRTKRLAGTLGSSALTTTNIVSAVIPSVISPVTKSKKYSFADLINKKRIIRAVSAIIKEAKDTHSEKLKIPDSLMENVISYPETNPGEMSDEIPLLGDKLLSILLQPIRGISPTTVVIFNTRTKKFLVNKIIVETIQTWPGFIPNKERGDEVLGKIVKRVCACTTRRLAPAAVAAEGNDSAVPVTPREEVHSSSTATYDKAFALDPHTLVPPVATDVAVHPPYIASAKSNANILFFAQEVAEGPRLDTFGFIYSRIIKHPIKRAPLNTYNGFFVDIICSQKRDPISTVSLLNFAVEKFAFGVMGVEFANLHSLAHVVPFYLKQGFKFQKDPLQEPVHLDGQPIDGAFVSEIYGAGKKQFPGCPYQVVGQEDPALRGYLYDSKLYRAIRAVNDADPEYVISSTSASRANLRPWFYGYSLVNGINMYKYRPDIDAEFTATRAAVLPAIPEGNGRRTARRANRKRRSTRRH